MDSIDFLRRTWGIYLPATYQDVRDADGIRMALDAQPALLNGVNNGVPSYLTNYFETSVIHALIAPQRAVEMYGPEKQMGSWTTKTATFPVIQSAGDVASYDDYSEQGMTDANGTFVGRDSYHFQTHVQLGELEVDMLREGNIDIATEKRLSAGVTLSTFQNSTYFFGVAGLRLYGALNDPSLPAPIQPAPTGTGNSRNWNDKTGEQIIGDLMLLVNQLINTSGQIIDMESPIQFNMSAVAQAKLLGKVNSFNISGAQAFRNIFPNATIKTAPQFSTDAGELVQALVTEYEGVNTIQPAFTVKLKAGPVVQGTSYTRQKMVQGTWGSIVRRPNFVASMLGV